MKALDENFFRLFMQDIQFCKSIEFWLNLRESPSTKLRL